MKKYVITQPIRKNTIIRYSSKFTVIKFKTFLTILNGIISRFSSHQLPILCIHGAKKPWWRKDVKACTGEPSNSCAFGFRVV